MRADESLPMKLANDIARWRALRTIAMDYRAGFDHLRVEHGMAHIRRWNTRQCRSVQSIIGATEKRKLLKLLYFCLNSITFKPFVLYRFISISSHFRPFSCTQYSNAVLFKLMLYRKKD
jgi:hypothetical protein